MAGIRRTWDKEFYEQKAKDRAEQGEEVYGSASSSSSSSSSNNRKSTSSLEEIKEEFVPAGSDEIGPMGSQRAFLKARQSHIDLDSKVGKTELIVPTNAEEVRGAGFWCDVCSCLLKDSSSYLDHINGKKHQRALGFSMRVERAGVDKVKERLSNIKRKIDDSLSHKPTSAIEDYDAKIASQIAEEELRKRRKKDEAMARKKEQEETEMENCDEDIAAIMGFGKLGKQKKESSDTHEKNEQIPQQKQMAGSDSLESTDDNDDIAAIMGFGQLGKR